jgi:hypothetical protein
LTVTAVTVLSSTEPLTVIDVFPVSAFSVGAVSVILGFVVSVAVKRIDS